MIWAKEETLPREEIEKIQLDKLKTTVSYIYDRVKPYRDKMDAAGVKPEDIQTLEDLKKLPFTYKADFRDHYPDGLFAVPLRMMWHRAHLDTVHLQEHWGFMVDWKRSERR